MNRSKKHTDLVNKIVTTANEKFMGRVWLQKRHVGVFDHKNRL